MITNDKSVLELQQEFESAAYNKEALVAVNTLVALLAWWDKINKGPGNDDGSLPGSTYSIEFSAAVNRTVTAWSFLLLDDDVDLSPLPISNLFAVLVTLHELYMATPMQNMDHAIHLLHKRTKGNYDSKNLLKLILLYTPNTKTGIDIRSFAGSVPVLAYAQMLAVVGAYNYIDERAHINRNEIINFLSDHGELDKYALELLDAAPYLFENAYMHCSYSDMEGKHRLKAKINQIIKLKHQQQIEALEKCLSDHSPA